MRIVCLLWGNGLMSGVYACVAGDVAVLVGRARRGVDVRAVLRAAAGAGGAGPRPRRRRRLAARRHAATRAATEAPTHRPPRGETPTLYYTPHHQYLSSASRCCHLDGGRLFNLNIKLFYCDNFQSSNVMCCRPSMHYSTVVP